MEEGVGFVDMWLNVVGRDDLFMRDGLYPTEKGSANLKGVQIRIQRNVHQLFWKMNLDVFV